MNKPKACIRNFLQEHSRGLLNFAYSASQFYLYINHFYIPAHTMLIIQFACGIKEFTIRRRKECSPFAILAPLSYAIFGCIHVIAFIVRLYFNIRNYHYSASLPLLYFILLISSAQIDSMSLQIAIKTNVGSGCLVTEFLKLIFNFYYTLPIY